MSHGITHVGDPSGVIDLPSGYLRPNNITPILSNVHTPAISPDDAILTEAEEILNLENQLYLAMDEDVSYWTPASLTTENWYDGADTSTITDTSGVVTQWDDKSGNANHLITNGSTISTNSRTLNSGNVMDVVEGTRFEKFPYQLPADCSIFMVAGIDFVNNGNDSLIGITGGGAKNFQFDSGDIVQVQDQFFARFNQTGIGTSNTFSPTTDRKGPSIYELIFDLNGDSDLEVFIDGTSFGTTAYNTQCGPNSTLLLFSNRGGGTLNDGLIAEVIIVPSVLSATDRQKAEGYLAHKWGLTSQLDAAHPYKTSRPLA